MVHAAKWLGLPGSGLVDLAPAKDSLKRMGSSNSNFPADGEPFSSSDQRRLAGMSVPDVIVRRSRP